MLTLRDRLKIKLYDGVSTYTDYSTVLADFMRDTQAITLTTDDEILLGYFKPLSQLYVDIPTTATAGATITLSYWNGSSWTAIDMVDETRGFSRSGFIQWDRSIIESLIRKSTNDSSEQYWYRIKVDTEMTITVGGISLLFCDVRDILTEDPNITDTLYLRGETSHIPAFVAARDDIIQELRNRGHLPIDESGYYKDLGPWDLLDVEQVRVACKFLTLSKIYMHLSDRDADNWSIKSKQYKDMYRGVINSLKLLSIDKDNSGERTLSNVNNTISQSWLVR